MAWHGSERLQARQSDQGADRAASRHRERRPASVKDASADADAENGGRGEKEHVRLRDETHEVTAD